MTNLINANTARPAIPKIHPVNANTCGKAKAPAPTNKLNK